MPRRFDVPHDTAPPEHELIFSRYGRDDMPADAT